FTQPCDVARRTLATQAIVYTQAPAPAGTPAKVTVNGKDLAIDASFAANLAKEAVAAGYPAAGDARIVKSGFMSALFGAQSLTVIAILTVLVIYVTMVYGPIAAALVELFPTRIRYTGMSLPYHIGNGWFGGLLPATSFAMVAGTGDIYYGLWYPIVIAMMTFVIGMLFVPETKDRDILTHDGG
ncbi:MAG: MFS transporter, partial [Hyphomicrobiales bacterium]